VIVVGCRSCAWTDQTLARGRDGWNALMATAWKHLTSPCVGRVETGVSASVTVYVLRDGATVPGFKRG
jgi:hypothetical protein